MHPPFRPLIAILCAGFVFAATGVAQEAPASPTMTEAVSGPQPSASPRTDQPRHSDPDVATAPVKETHVLTHHSVTVEGKEIAYDAVAGTLTLRDDQGKPAASMFYVAYVASAGQADHRRPVTFFYNGGPGSASLWLHLGSFGPLRVATNAPESTPGPPFQMVTNTDTLLGKTDLVFLDAIGTGYSRVLGDTKEDKFWSVDSDIDAFARAITRYLTLNDRWNSPKVSVRRILRHHAIGGTGVRAPEAERAVQRRHDPLLYP